MGFNTSVPGCISVPFAPIGEEKRKQLQVLTLERTRNGFQGGLLPSAACLPVLEDFITANHTGGVKLERLSLCLGP